MSKHDITSKYQNPGVTYFRILCVFKLNTLFTKKWKRSIFHEILQKSSIASDNTLKYNNQTVTFRKNLQQKQK